jgi:hypothetical protein
MEKGRVHDDDRRFADHHRKAVTAPVSHRGQEAHLIESKAEKRPGRLAGARDEGIVAIREAQSVLILGTGEAKGELRKRPEREKIGGRILTRRVPAVRLED